MRHARADRELPFAPVTVERSCCTAKPALARPPCWTVWRSRRPRTVGCSVLPASSRRWNSPSPRCTSCARRCSSRLDDLPEPQRDALRTAFGISAGPPPDRFLVALAVLSLLSDVADERPLLFWWTTNSGSIRRPRRCWPSLRAAWWRSRWPSSSPPACRAPTSLGCRELVVSGLAKTDARALLDAELTAPLDAQVRDQIVAETHGNPLALVELPRGLTPLELAGGFGLPGAGTFAGSVEESFRRRLDALPEPTRRLLLLAAAETAGDSTLVWRAAALLGIDADAATPATDADLVEFGTRVRFRHPLVRSAAYRSASLQDRQRVHHALAEVTDPELDADRRAWHRAEAALGPDEDVAVELERSADRAKARGGLAAAAAFLERATMLTLDRAQRAGRALAAASAKVDAGRLRRGAGSAGHRRGRTAHRAPARPARSGARAARVRDQPRPRRATASAEGGQTARAHRRQPVPRHVSRRVRRPRCSPAVSRSA